MKMKSLLATRKAKLPWLSAVTTWFLFLSVFLSFLSMILPARLGKEVVAALGLKGSATERQQGTEFKDSVQRTRTAAATVTNRWSRQPSGRWAETGQGNWCPLLLPQAGHFRYVHKQQV